MPTTSDIEAAGAKQYPIVAELPAPDVSFKGSFLTLSSADAFSVEPFFATAQFAPVRTALAQRAAAT